MNKKLKKIVYLTDDKCRQVKLYDLLGNRVSSQMLSRSVNRNWKTLGVNFMKNRNFIVGLALFGLAAQAFVLLSGKGLDSATASVFNTASIIVLFVAFILSVFSQRSDCKINAERDEIYRDIDAVYRHISDVNRDVTNDIRSLEDEVNRRSKK